MIFNRKWQHPSTGMKLPHSTSALVIIALSLASWYVLLLLIKITLMSVALTCLQ